jgi:hypothetical protein
MDLAGLPLGVIRESVRIHVGQNAAGLAARWYGCRSSGTSSNPAGTPPPSLRTGPRAAARCRRCGARPCSTPLPPRTDWRRRRRRRAPLPRRPGERAARPWPRVVHQPSPGLAPRGGATRSGRACRLWGSMGRQSRGHACSRRKEASAPRRSREQSKRRRIARCPYNLLSARPAGTPGFAQEGNVGEAAGCQR